jgi:hypothetical protein
VSGTTIENWGAQGILPPPRKRGGKLMWKWEEVDAWLTNGSPDRQGSEADDIGARMRKAMQEDEQAKERSRELRRQREATRVRLREASKALNEKLLSGEKDDERSK